jgi:hypothetical protein
VHVHVCVCVCVCVHSCGLEYKLRYANGYTSGGRRGSHSDSGHRQYARSDYYNDYSHRQSRQMPS